MSIFNVPTWAEDIEQAYILQANGTLFSCVW
jgi:hypothetical protein